MVSRTCTTLTFFLLGAELQITNRKLLDLLLIVNIHNNLNHLTENIHTLNCTGNTLRCSHYITNSRKIPVQLLISFLLILKTTH